MTSRIQAALAFIGVESTPAGHAEKLISALGGFAGIIAVFAASAYFVGLRDSALIVASMGSSAVLLFAVPHGALSQPWPLVGGHAISALVGVTAATYIPDTMTAAAVSVGGAILGMYYLRCIHAPGGATALTAVVGGPGVQALGFQFVLTPVLVNTLIILLAAVAVNYAFAWRRYPAALVRPGRDEADDADAGVETNIGIEADDLDYALQRIGSFIDVTGDDLVRIIGLARRHAETSHLDRAAIKVGSCYTNCEYGRNWSIRRVVDESGDDDPERDTIIYKVVAGHGRRGTGVCTREEFARWARYEVFQNESSWLKVSPQRGE